MLPYRSKSAVPATGLPPEGTVVKTVGTIRSQMIKYSRNEWVKYISCKMCSDDSSARLLSSPGRWLLEFILSFYA